MDVKDSRPTSYLEQPSIRRRRRCNRCGVRLTTFEVRTQPPDLAELVRKLDGLHAGAAEMLALAGRMKSSFEGGESA